MKKKIILGIVLTLTLGIIGYAIAELQAGDVYFKISYRDDGSVIMEYNDKDIISYPEPDMYNCKFYIGKSGYEYLKLYTSEENALQVIEDEIKNPCFLGITTTTTTLPIGNYRIILEEGNK